MSRRRAPAALRTPISFVRSTTDASSTFMMPMPPTMSEMAVKAPIRILKMRMPWFMASNRSRPVDAIVTCFRPRQSGLRRSAHSSACRLDRQDVFHPGSIQRQARARGASCTGTISVSARANGTTTLRNRSPGTTPGSR